MKIVANNKEDFEKQYYQQFDNRPSTEILIELETDDNFWEDLTKIPYNTSILTFNFMGVVPPDFKSISQFFIVNYGNIKRV
jgi:hypothetical protein